MDPSLLRQRSTPKKKPHLIVKIILLTLLAVVLVAGAYGVKVYTSVKNAVDKTYQKIDNQEVNSAITGDKPLSILLLGTDTGEFGRTEKGNSDTMIVVTINPKTNKTTMTSIPRDTMAQIQGTKESDDIQKINAAYNLGDSTAAVKTVEKLLNIPIQYYVTINMAGLAKIVDAVGGVDVNVPFSWTDANTGNQTFKKGPAHLNGQRALAYARMRYEDPEGDYGRQKRQQEVIGSIVKSALDVDSLANYEKVLDSMSSSLRMNLTFDDLVAIASHYRKAASNITHDQLKGVGAYIGDGAYEIPSTSELQRVSNKIRKQLELPTEKLSNENTRQNKLNVNFDWKAGNNPSYTLYNEDGSIMN